VDNIILIGGGGHCRSVIDVIELESKYNIFGIVDIEEKVGTVVSGYEVISSDDKLELLSKDVNFALVTIGHIYNNSARKNLFKKIRNLGFVVPTIISPRAYVSKSSSILEGTVVMHDVLINSQVKVGRDCIINSKALLEHDVNIGDDCHISTSATINGGVNIGDNCFIGSNVATKESIEICSNSFIKAGSTVR